MDAVSIKTTTIRYNKKPEAAVQYEIVLLAGSVYVENNKLHGSARWQVVKATGAAREKVKNNLSDYVCRCGFTDEPANAAGKSGTIEWNDNRLIEGKEWGMAGIGFPDRFTIVFGELKGSVFTQLARADVYVNKEKVNIRENLLYCSLFNEQRMSWWQASRAWNKESSYIGIDKPIGGVYAMDGYNLFELHAKPGQMEDLRQQLYTFDSGGRRQSKLKSNTWYTLSFKVRGVLRDTHADGTFTDVGECPVVLYVTNNVSGLSTGIIDTSAGVIIDGTPTKPYPYGDMSVLIKCGWAITTHTITFKTRALVSNSESAHAPTLYIRSFGKGYSGFMQEEFVKGGAYFRVAALKLEEGQEATAFTPHVTETLSPIYSTAFIRSVETPSAPSGGSYSSPNPTTRGWSDGIPPTGDGRLWASSAIFYPEVSGATWSTPAPMTDTSTSDVEFCPYDGIPNVPSETVGKADWNLAPAKTKPNATMKLWFDINRNSDLTKEEQAAMKWRAECQIENGKRGTWWISKAKGEDGTSFAPKGSAEAHFDSETAFANATRVAGKYYLVDSTPNAKLYLWNGSNAVAQTVEDNWAYTTADFTLWVKSGVKWVSFGKIQGPQGPQGPQGDSAWSYAVVADINAIPVNSQGLPLITSFKISKNITHGSEIVAGTGYSISYSIVAKVDGKEQEVKSGSTDEDSLTVDLSVVSSLVISRIICNLLDSSGKQVHSITLYPLKNGSNGEDSIRLDLSNEMDAVAADEYGNVSARLCSTVVSLFKGAERITLTKKMVKATNSDSYNNDVNITENTDGSVKVDYAVRSLGDNEALTETITVRYNGTDYKADFTIVAQKQGVKGNTGAPGNDAVLYQLNPSDTALVFARDDGGNFTETSKTITCGLLSIVGKETTIVTDEKPSYENLYLYYSLDGGKNYANVWFNTSIDVQNTADSVKLVLSSYYYGSSETGSNMNKGYTLDTETIPVIKEGRKGDAGDSTVVQGARGVGVFRRFMNGEQLYYRAGEQILTKGTSLSYNNLETANKAVLIEGQIRAAGSTAATISAKQYKGAYAHIMFGNTKTDLSSTESVVSDMSNMAYEAGKLKSYLIWRLSSSRAIEYDPSKYQILNLSSIGGYISVYDSGVWKYIHIRFGRSLSTLTKTPESSTTDSSYKMFVSVTSSSSEPGIASGSYSDWSSGVEYSDFLINNSYTAITPVVAVAELDTLKSQSENFASTANETLYIIQPAKTGSNRIDITAETTCIVTNLRISLLDTDSFNSVDGQYLGTYSSNVEDAPDSWVWYTWCRFRDPNNIQRVPVPAGNYSSNVVYEATDIVSPMVKQGDNYYMMCRSGITQGLDPYQDASLDNPTTWMKVDKYNAVYTEIIMASLGLIGKAVFNGDFMYSQQGYTIDSNGNRVAQNYGNFGMPDFEDNSKFHPNVLIDFVQGLLRCRKAVVEESTFNDCTVTGSCSIGALKMVANKLSNGVVDCGYIAASPGTSIKLPTIKEGEYLKIIFYNPPYTRTGAAVYVTSEQDDAIFIFNSYTGKEYSQVNMGQISFAEFHGAWAAPKGKFVWNIIVNQSQEISQ